MRLLEASTAFITVLTNSATALLQAKSEISELRTEVNSLRTENAALKGEAAEAIELLETAVNLNGPVDELAQVVIDSDEIETPTALEDPAIGDPAVATSGDVLVEAAKAITDSVVGAEATAESDFADLEGVEPS